MSSSHQANAQSNSKNIGFKKPNGDRSIYQICEKIGHGAQSCFVLRVFILEKSNLYVMFSHHKGNKCDKSN